MLLILALQFFHIVATKAEANDTGDIYELSLEELWNLQVTKVGTLTSTTFRHVPAAVTRITQDDIFSSGARDMIELLDIYVPGLQWIRHNFEIMHLGIRGIISDREDKIMIRLNGKVMNERTHIGAISERDFPMMDDIRYIDIIRGAGSAVYGLGAVSMVIDIHTFDGQTATGGSVTLRGGGLYNFGTLSLQNTFDLPKDRNLYVYAAGGLVDGASTDNAPIVYGPAYTTRLGADVASEHELPHQGARDGSQYRYLPPIKFHMQLNGKQSQAWVRYTRGGENFPKFITQWAAFPVGTRRDLLGQERFGRRISTADPYPRLGG